MKILVHPADQLGCGFYRMLMPAYVMQAAGHDVNISAVTLDDVSMYDSIVFQRVHRQGFKEIFAQYRRQAPNALIVMDIDDDLYNLPHIFTKADCDRFTESCNSVDRVIVSTDFLKQRLIEEGVTSQIHVRRNMVSLEFWTEEITELPKLPNGRKKILMTGAMGHKKNGDLDQILHFPKKLAKGHALMVLGDELKKVWGGRKNVAFIPWCRVNEYPTVVRILNADFWLAPLNPNMLFNKSKSNIKYLEATMAGAILCAKNDAFPYLNLPGVIYYDNIDELVRRINTISSEEQVELYKEAAEHVAANYLLEMDYGLAAIIESWS